jgi:hypothetical protein
MTEPVVAVDPVTEAQPAQVESKTESPPAQPAKPATDWVAEAKKWESRAKENRSAAVRLAEIEEAQKTELQKAQARAEAAEKRAAEFESRAAEFESRQQIAEWKEAISEKTGVPVGVLRGTTEEDIKAHAESLKQFIPDPNARPRVGTHVPAEGRTVGVGGTDPAAQFADIIRKARGIQ